MTKKKAHIILSILDLLVIEGIISFYYDFRQIIMDTSNYVDMISFSNRMGFSVLGVGLLIIHLMVIVEHFKPELIKKNNKMMNAGLIALAIALIVTAFTGSEWIKSKVENAGYVYCRKASGASALAKTLVYTKNMEICEKLVETKSKR